MKSKRLLTIASFIEKGDVVADIGSDHGLLPIYLLKNGHEYVFASDNKKEPYERLMQAFKNANYSDKAEVSLSDGIEKLPEKVNTLVLAGMGGQLIIDILGAHSDKLDNVEKLILAPHGNEGEVRKMISFLGYQIYDEEVVEEAGKFYEIIVAHNVPCAVCGVEVVFGPQNLHKKTPTFVAKWTEVYAKNEELLQNTQLDQGKREELTAMQAQIENAIDLGEEDEY